MIIVRASSQMKTLFNIAFVTVIIALMRIKIEAAADLRTRLQD